MVIDLVLAGADQQPRDRSPLFASVIVRMISALRGAFARRPHSVPTLCREDRGVRAVAMPKISREGTVGLLFEVTLAILDHLHVREPLIIWGLFVVGFLLISDATIRSDWATRRHDPKTTRKRRSLGMLIVLLVFALFGLWIYRRTHKETIVSSNSRVNLTVSPAFESLYKEYGQQLGQPTGPPENINIFYQAVHQSATFVWMDNPLKFYLVDKSGKWHEEIEDRLPPGGYGTCPWYCDDELRKMFPPPASDLGPPFGSAAYKWSKDPARWEQMLGWREWQCNFEANAVHYQNFEHGRALGPMRFRPSRAADKFSSNGLAVALLNDGTWRSAISRETPHTYPCEEPLTPLLKP